MIAVLTSPHLNPHDLTLLIFPGWIIAAYAVRGNWNGRLSAIWLALLWLGYVLPSLGDPGALVIPSVVLMAVVTMMLAVPGREQAQAPG